MTNRRNTPFTLEEAANESPSLARLVHLSRLSSDWLRKVSSLIPTQLNKTITAGPIEDGHWCLIVDGNAAAAKLRQCVPNLLAHLQATGEDITSIRLKVRSLPKTVD